MFSSLKNVQISDHYIFNEKTRDRIFKMVDSIHT